MGPFDRFSPAARVAIEGAVREADELGSAWIGCGHLLVGLLQDERSDAAQALLSCNVTLAAARNKLGRRTPTGGQPVRCFAPEALDALSRSLGEALHVGSTYIGPEHLLLAVLAVPTRETSELLKARGTNEVAVRSQARLMASQPGGWEPEILRATALIHQRFGDNACE